MAELLFFPFVEYWWFYAGFTACVLFMLALDLGVFHRTAHAVSFKEAAVWSVIWVGLALAFNYGFYLYATNNFAIDARLTAVSGFEPNAAAKQVGLEFLTGYIVEKSLSVDNIFVFVVVFSFFSIPPKYQHRVLFYGIIGALIFRAIFIAMGSVLMQYSWIVIFFGALLILTGVKMIFAPEKGINPEKNPAIRLFKRFMPVTPKVHGQSFFIRIDGRLCATPLFVALLFLEMTDVIFAVDSVPAIFALTREPLIVYTSNVFAILGLRAMYFMLAGAVDKFHMLKFGLALVLMFVGLKMVWLNDAFGGKFPITWSLGIILSVVAISVVLSLIFPRKVRSLGTAHE
ncbi:MAG: TerC family protein [Candidatus Hydrogenedentes bacterium]|nr:TerC family protein [Candidatus Hydrogenedentota bacterium]